MKTTSINTVVKAYLLFALVATAAATAAYSATIPIPNHVIVIVEENHSYSEIYGSSSAPYINSLANSGALFTNSFAIEHPSEPNYLDLFSGSNQGVTDDSCPHSFTDANLGAQLLAVNLGFAGYSEDLPSIGATDCTFLAYARKHAPWVNWQGTGTNLIPPADNLPFANFPTNYTTLPTVSFVIPNLNDDMHDGTIAQGDTWLKNNLDAYIQWAKTNNSLLIVTFDEDDSTQNNQVLTFFCGPMVKTGTYPELINHYNVLRTLEDMFGLPYAGNAATATPITDCWVTGPDFSISDSPNSQTVTQGSGTNYTTTVTALNGFTGTTNLSVSGLPTGATGTFNPASLNGSGTSTLSVSTSSTTPAGTYTLTVTGTSGTLTHSTTVTLVVNSLNPPDFSISASPSSQTVQHGSSTSYTVTIGSVNGFAGTVNFSVSGLPNRSGGSFNPTSVAGSGSSILTVTTSHKTGVGTKVLTITGTSGSLTHSTNVTLVVQ